MPFNDNLPAENTNPWYTPLVAAWTNLKTFVNGLETAIATKVNSSTYVAGMATKASTEDLDNVFTIASAAIPATQKGAANGVASLGADSKLPAAQLPALAITEFLGTSADQAAMLAKTGQQGDWTTRLDLGTVWIITGSTPTQLSSWTQMTYPTAPVTTVAGRTGAVVLTKTDVGLNLVDNTSDAGKPVSTAQAAALALKAPLASPTFTGTVSGVTKAMVGLPNVDNTSDVNKPVSTAQAAAISAAVLHTVESADDSVTLLGYRATVEDIPAGSPEGSIWFVASDV